MQLLPPFRLARPRDLAEASAMLAGDPNARILAGGTDLVANLRDGLAAPSTLVDLGAIEELATIGYDAQGIRIGACVTLARLAVDVRIKTLFPAIAEAAASVAGPAHRSVATVGGNLCLGTRCVFYNQSEGWRRANGYCLKYRGDVCHVAPQGKSCEAAYSGDLAPALLAFDAEVELAGAGGSRRIALADLYVEDGAAHLALRANLLDYRVPTIVESPPIEVHIVESRDPGGPFGAKEAGEGSLAGFLAALTNAVHDAVGLRLTELPASPDRVLEALQARRRSQRVKQARTA